MTPTIRNVLIVVALLGAGLLIQAVQSVTQGSKAPAAPAPTAETSALPAVAAAAPPAPLPADGKRAMESTAAGDVRGERERPRTDAPPEAAPAAQTPTAAAPPVEPPPTERILAAIADKAFALAVAVFQTQPEADWTAIRAKLRRTEPVAELAAAARKAAKAGKLREAADALELANLLTGRPGAAEVERWKLRAHDAEAWQAALATVRRGVDSPGGVRLAVQDVHVKRAIRGDFLTYTSGSATMRYVVLDMIVTNKGDTVRHVNPLDFTETVCRQDVNPSEASYAIRNRLEATNVSPGSFVVGSLVFPIDVRCGIMLHYRTIGDEVDLPIAMPWSAAP